MVNHTIPVMQIRPNSLLVYEQTLYYHGDSKTSANHKRHDISKENRYSGKMSAGAIKRIRTAVSYLMAISPNQKVYNPITQREQTFRINLITLTLSAQVPVSEERSVIDKVFKPFMQRLKSKFGVKDYIWKVERQPTSKRLHWHITTNRFISYDKLRREWNWYQNRIGIIDRFKAEHGHSDPNSTDIHAVRKVKNLESYISKYISKKAEEEEEKVYGKVWDCSTNLKGIRNVSMAMESTHFELWKQAKATKGSRLVQLEKCDIVTLQEQSFIRLLREHKFNEYQELLQQIKSK